MNKIPKDKYLRKNEFRYNSNPDVRNKNGEGHIAYVTVRHKRRSKINIITHASTFYGEPTYPLEHNPEIFSSYKKKSRFSVPRWEHNSYLTEKPKGVWFMRKKDRIALRKVNRKYAKTHK